MKLLGPKLRDRLDLWVAKFDPAGVGCRPGQDDGMWRSCRPRWMAGVFGNIHAADGAALAQRLDALAATVCQHDPRTCARRADASARWRGAGRPGRQCGSSGRPGRRRHATAATVIHVLADRPPSTAAATSRATCPGSDSAHSVRELATSARLTRGGAHRAAPHPGYRPSAATLEFLRWRDLTCRWPGCDRPAEKSPYRSHRALAARTHPSLEHQAHRRSHHRTAEPPLGTPTDHEAVSHGLATEAGHAVAWLPARRRGRQHLH